MKETMKTQTTPRPWTVLSQNVMGDVIYFIKQQNNPSEARSNVELIVRAVNSHDALLEALKSLLNCPRLNDDFEKSDSQTMQAVNKAEEALKQAEGE